MIAVDIRKAKRIVVTSALPYANGPIHIGHLVEYIQTDIFVRFHRLVGKDIIYCCADDTHGTPIQIKAEELHISPEELIAKVHKEHLMDFNAFSISFDSYYSTNSPENKAYADKIFHTLNKKGLIYQKEVENFYDERAKRFLPDRYVKGQCPKCSAKDQYGDVCEICNATYKPIDLINPYSVITKTTPVRRSSIHYFFRLSSLSASLDAWLQSNKNLQPEIVNYVRNWIKEGLQDWDISRDGPYFGFTIPGEENKYYYVWLDAPVGYIASTQNYCRQHGLDAEKDYWRNSDSTIVHFIGKDITYFHFLFWPAMLKETRFNLPDDIVVHGFLTVDGEKMSKSRGTFYTARDFLAKYDPEYLRFYYARSLSKKMADIDLDFKDFADSVNNELVANIGNFTYRVLSFLERNFDSSYRGIDDYQIFGEILALSQQIRKDYEGVNFKSVMHGILRISSIGNKYFQDNEPWKVIKADPEKARKVLGSCVNVVKILSILLAPILPGFSEKLTRQIGLSNLSWADINFSLTAHKVGKAEVLFRKMEIKSDKVFPLDLRVAKILEVKDHPDAEKLYVLQVDLGSEKRQLVAGLRKHYTSSGLLGKTIIIVSNLKHAKLRGVESQGMLLAGDDGKSVGLLTTDAPSGTKVELAGYSSNQKTISYEEFQKIKIEIQQGKAIVGGQPLAAAGKAILVERVGDGSAVR